MGLDTSKFAKKANLASLKSEIDKLDIDQLGTTPVNLTKLSDVIKMKLFKRLFMMNWLNKLITLVLVDLFKKTDYDNKITEIEGKIPSVTGLATTSALNAFKKEIPTVSDLVEKAEYDEKYETL